MNSKKIATTIEYLFYPPLSIMYGVTLLLYYLRTQSFFNNVMSLFFISVVFSISVLIIRTKVKEINLRYFIAILVSVSSYLSFTYFFPVAQGFLFFMVSLIATSFLVFIVRRKWKVSAHMASISIIVSILAVINFQFIVLAILFIPIAWCRLKLKRHTPIQVVVGTIFGFIVPILLSFVFLNKII